MSVNFVHESWILGSPVLPKHRTLSLHKWGSYSDTATTRLLSPPEPSLLAERSLLHDSQRLKPKKLTEISCPPTRRWMAAYAFRDKTSSGDVRIDWCHNRRLLSRREERFDAANAIICSRIRAWPVQFRKAEDVPLIHRLGRPTLKVPASRGPKLTDLVS